MLALISQTNVSRETFLRTRRSELSELCMASYAFATDACCGVMGIRCSFMMSMTVIMKEDPCSLKRRLITACVLSFTSQRRKGFALRRRSPRRCPFRVIISSSWRNRCATRALSMLAPVSTVVIAWRRIRLRFRCETLSTHSKTSRVTQRSTSEKRDSIPRTLMCGYSAPTLERWPATTRSLMG